MRGGCLCSQRYYSRFNASASPPSLERHRLTHTAPPPSHSFIITHQAYELWFKQLLHELHSVRRLFDVPHVDERDMGVAVSRLSRVAEIEKVLIQQITVLETMSALDFLAFRDVLFPASGFQSVQFRLVENALGLEAPTRLSYGGKSGYCSVLHEADAAKVLASEAQPSLFVLVEKWLERTPFLEFVDDAGSGVVGGAVLAGEGVTSGGGGACSGGGGLGVGGLGAPIDSGGQGGSKPDGDGLRTGVGLGDGAAIPDGRPSSPVRFSFWAHYSSAISAMLSADEAFIRSQTLYTPASRDANLRDIESQRAHFELLLNPELYEASRARGERRLSHRATQAALMIIAFQREPLFQVRAVAFGVGCRGRSCRCRAHSIAPHPHPALSAASLPPHHCTP